MNNVWLAGPEAIQSRFLNIATTQILSHEATAWIYNPSRHNASAVVPQEGKMIDVTLIFNPGNRSAILTSTQGHGTD